MFRKGVPFLVLFIGLLLGFSACSEYNKVVKGTDLKKKYDTAIALYNDGKYFKAYPLFEELATIYRGTGRAEKVYYYYAFTEFGLGQMDAASYRFETFYKSFPKSEYAEECQFMSAYCFYLNSPNYSLDQTSTYQAIQQLQLFIDQYPLSQRVDSCNVLVDKLRGKLERKAYETAKLYYKTQYYRSAIVAYENMLIEFPDSDYREESTFMIFKANYRMAIGSVERLKLERLNTAMKAYVKFVDAYPESKYIREAEQMYDNALREKEKLSTPNS
mgnify:CR=1 FL=1